MNPDEPDMLAAALDLARRGWRVHPLYTPTPAGGCDCGQDCGKLAGKHPRIKSWQHAATTDEKTIRKWWQKWRRANIGVATGPGSNLTVIDIDPEKDGRGSWLEIEAQARRMGTDLTTPEAITGSGGTHCLFAYPEEVRIPNRQGWLPGVDVRGDGGYIVAPPSLHRSGRRYAWDLSLHPEDTPLAALPDWLLTRLLEQPAAASPSAPGVFDPARDAGAPADPLPILQGCAWLRHCEEDAKGLGYLAWYAMLSIVGRCEDGPALAHQWSKAHPEYRPEDTEKYLKSALTRAGPASCAFIRQRAGGEAYCADCLHWGRITSPIGLARGKVAALSAQEPPAELPMSAHSAEDLELPMEPLEPAAPPAPAAPRERSSPALPHSAAMEQCALGNALTTAGGLSLLTARLERGDFYLEPHRLVYDALARLAAAGAPVHPASLREDLETARTLSGAGGAERLQDLAAAAVPEHQEYACQVIRRKTIFRRILGLQGMLRDAIETADEPGIAEIRRRQEDLWAEYNSAGGPRVRPRDASELLSLVLPEPRWAIPGLLPAGLNLLVAKSKIGKSFWALQAGLALATGGKAFGWQDVAPALVLCLFLEDTERRLQQRLRYFTTGLDPAARADLPRLRIASSWPVMDDGGGEELRHYLRAHPGIRLVVIDTLERFRRRRSAAANAYAEDYAAANEIKAIADEFEVCILVLHHERKGKAGDWADDVSGSAGIPGSADSTLLLKRNRAEDRALLHLTGRDIEERTLALRWHGFQAPGTLGWEILGDADEIAASTEQEELLRLLKEAGKPLRFTELVSLLRDTLGIEAGAAKMRVCRCFNAGLIAREGTLYYVVSGGSDSNPVTRLATKQPSAVTSVTGVTGVTSVTSVTSAEEGTPVTDVTPVTEDTEVTQVTADGTFTNDLVTGLQSPGPTEAPPELDLPDDIPEAELRRRLWRLVAVRGWPAVLIGTFEFPRGYAAWHRWLSAPGASQHFMSRLIERLSP